MDFKTQFQNWVGLVNRTLENLIIDRQDVPEKSIYTAMKYSIEAGGKRLRPVLAIAVCDLLEEDINEVLPYACAIEMIHTYSLIHDDLPAMDNDDYRRGRLTNHKVFGEAMAILAGDALLNYAFEVMLNNTVRNPGNTSQKVEAMSIIAKASGVSGMIGGQVVDMESENKEISAGLLEYMHRCKTGALIKAPVMASAVLCKAAPDVKECLEQFAEKLGLAFQIKDDILDIEGSTEKLGKKIGSDTANNKSTFVTIYGLEKSKRMLEEITQDAINTLKVFGSKSDFLISLARYLLEREN
jgi:geranylgeranyl diphosphate synthase type II